MFVLDGKLVTPKLSSAILDGITRNTLLTIAHDMGITVEERKISIAEIEKAFQQGNLTEAFGAGTAAVVSPVATINIHGKDYNLPAVNDSMLQMKLKEKLNSIRSGAEADKHQWNYIIR